MFQGIGPSHLAGGCGALGRTIGVNTAFKKGFERHRAAGGKLLHRTEATTAIMAAVADDEYIGGRVKVVRRKERLVQEERKPDWVSRSPRHLAQSRGVVVDGRVEGAVNAFWNGMDEKSFRFPGGDTPSALFKLAKRKFGRGEEKVTDVVIYFLGAEEGYPLFGVEPTNTFIRRRSVFRAEFVSRLEGESALYQEGLCRALRAMMPAEEKKAAAVQKKPVAKPYGGAVIRPKRETPEQFRERLVAEGKIKPNTTSATTGPDGLAQRNVCLLAGGVPVASVQKPGVEARPTAKEEAKAESKAPVPQTLPSVSSPPSREDNTGSNSPLGGNGSASSRPVRRHGSSIRGRQFGGRS